LVTADRDPNTYLYSTVKSDNFLTVYNGLCLYSELISSSNSNYKPFSGGYGNTYYIRPSVKIYYTVSSMPTYEPTISPKTSQPTNQPITDQPSVSPMTMQPTSQPTNQPTTGLPTIANIVTTSMDTTSMGTTDMVTNDLKTTVVSDVGTTDNIVDTTIVDTSDARTTLDDYMGQSNAARLSITIVMLIGFISFFVGM